MILKESVSFKSKCLIQEDLHQTTIMKTFLILSFAVLAVTAAPPKEASGGDKTKRHLTDSYISYGSYPQSYYNSYGSFDAYSSPLLASSAQFYSSPVVTQEVAQHTVHNVVNKVPVAVPQPYAVPVTKTVQVPQPYPVNVEKPVPVQVRVNVPYAVDKPYPVEVPQPVPYQVKVKVPYAVEKPYPVHITKTVPVAVEKPVYVKVPEVVKVPVAQPYPVPVQRKVAVTVPEPVVVKVPEYINVHHNVYKQPVYRQQYVEQVGLPLVSSQHVIGHDSALLSSGIQSSEIYSGVEVAPPCPLSHNQGSLVIGSYGAHNIFARNSDKADKADKADNKH